MPIRRVDTGLYTYTNGTFGSTTGSYNDLGNQSETFGSYGQRHLLAAIRHQLLYELSSRLLEQRQLQFFQRHLRRHREFELEHDLARDLERASGSGNINDSSSGISTSGAQVNSNYTFTSNYAFNGNGSGSGNYTLHEEGTFGNGTYGAKNL
jgi:hypothetical protein